MGRAQISAGFSQIPVRGVPARAGGGNKRSFQVVSKPNHSLTLAGGAVGAQSFPGIQPNPEKKRNPLRITKLTENR